MSEILYMKIERNSRVTHADVRLGDVAGLECVNRSVTARLNAMRIFRFREQEVKRYVISVMKVIEMIHELYPQLEIQNLGESEFIVEYDISVQKSEILEIVKVAVLCVLIFIGSAFSMMVFNNDVGVDDVFARTYELLTGQPSSGYTVMELMYSVGIAVGVIVFYNHFGKKRFTDDPTPIEVQMRLYEDDVNTALAAESSRRNKTIDVD